MIYRAENGSVGLVGEGGTTTFAYAGEDFISQRESVRLEDGQQSAVIAIHVIDVRMCMSNNPICRYTYIDPYTVMHRSTQ